MPKISPVSHTFFKPHFAKENVSKKREVSNQIREMKTSVPMFSDAQLQFLHSKIMLLSNLLYPRYKRRSSPCA